MLLTVWLDPDQSVLIRLHVFVSVQVYLIVHWFILKRLSAGPLQANTAVFEACSKERIQPFDDDEEDIWEEKEINFATQTKSRNRSDTPHCVA